MAYAIKYLFKFESSNGTTREIRVLQDGYTGEVIQRPLGRAPILKKQQNGPVHGTSLEFFAECNVDREFIEFYTSDPKAYRVDLYAGAVLLWQGYITPELYSEPDIAPPYDVQVVATDGVGELKLYDYAAQGAVTLRALLSGLLSRTGLGTDIYLISSLKPGSAGAGSLLEKTINLDYMAGNSCYEVLTYILDTLHATITWWKGAWILSRETNVTFTNGKVRYFNTAGNSALLNDSVQVLGKMYANPAWPVGQLSTVIDPAKNRVTVQAPWHVVTCLRNSDMGSDADWTKAKNARYETDGYILPVNINTGTSETAVISQATSMAGLRVPMSLSVKATGATSEISAQVVGAVLGVLLTYKVGNVTYHLVKGDDGVPVWQQGGDIGTYIPLRTRIDFQQQLATWDSSRIEAEELSIENIPPFLQGTTFPAGTLTVYILGYCAKIYGAYLDVVLPKGYQDILRISNGARGEGSEVEIAIGRETTDNAYYAAFLQGLLLDSGNLITSFADANFPGGMDYLAFIARDYALSVALPRAKVTGTVYLESGIAAPPLVFTKGALNYWLQTWSWNLYEDELEIEGLTLPSASLTVESETILESTASANSSTGRASGGGAPISPGTSMSAVQEWVNGQGYLSSVEAASTYATITALNGVSGRVTTLEGRTNWDTYFGVDENGDIYVKKNGNTARNFYSWGAVSAGGLSSGGGSEGASLPAVWASLKTNSDDYANEKINAYHIPIGSGLSVVNGLIVANNAGTVTSVKVGTTTYNPTDGVVSLPAYPTSLPASDVYSWAKAETKPSYAFSEITGTASTSQIPTLAISKISGLQTALDGKQPLDADLTAIAGLTGTSGFLKKTATNTWALDTNTYLTGITSTMVTNALGYTPANVTALADYVTIATAQTISSLKTMTAGLKVSGRVYSSGDDEGIVVEPISSGYAGLTLGSPTGRRSVFYLNNSIVFWRYNNGTASFDISHPAKSGTIALTSDIDSAIEGLDSSSESVSSGYFLTGVTITNGKITARTQNNSISGSAGSLTTVSKTAWGQTYWTSGGVPTSISGDMSSVGKMTFTAKTSKSTSGNVLEVVTIDGVTYLHSVLPFVSDSFISAGGVSSGGGTSGVDLTAVWNNLIANTGEGLNKKIHTAHLPTVTITGTNISGTGTYSGTGGSASTLTLNLTAVDTTYSAGTGISLSGTTFSLASSGVTAGTYYKTTVDTYGRVTAGSYSNLSAAINGDLTEGTSNPTDTDYYIAQYAGGGTSTTSYHRRPHSALYNYINGKLASAHAGLDKVGTVTSVGLSMPTGFSVSSSPITSSGTLTVAFASGYSLPTTEKQSNWDTAYGWGNNHIHYTTTPIADANTADGGTPYLYYINSSYGTTTNTPSAFGALLDLNIDAGHLQFFAASDQNEIYARSYWWTTRSEGITYPDWVKLYHSGNLTQSVVTGLIGSTTYAPYNSAGYLPLTGGTISNSTYYPLTINNSTSGAKSVGIQFNGADSRLGNIYVNGSNNTLHFYYGDSDNVIYHSGNSNKSDVAWACSTLTASGNIQANAGVTLANNQSLGGLNTGGTRVSLLSIDSSNAVFLAWGAAGAGYDTHISGNNISFRYGTSHTIGMYLNSSSNVGIGTTTPSQKLHVAGNILATGAITAGSASDARLKTNIRALSDSDAKTLIMALRPVTYTWNDKATELYDQYKGDDLGFVAQEVEKVLPGAIGTIFDKYKRLDQTKFIAPLVKVAQDHETRIERLEKEVKVRDAKIMELESEVKRLRMN